MKNCTFPFKALFALAFILFFNFKGFGQTTIWTEDFTTGTYAVTLGGEGNDGIQDYFQTTDGSNINISYTGNTGNYFACQDIDDGGWTGSAIPSQLTWTGINILSYTSLEFQGDFASNSSGGIDAADFALVEYQIDGGGWNNLLAFQNDGTTFNTEFGEDTDFDGNSDGTDLSAAFLSFTKSISGTGTTLDLRITVSVNSGGEDFAFESFEVSGISGSPTPTITVTPSSLTGFTYVEGSGPSTEQSFDVSGVNLTTDILVTTATGWEISTTSGGPYQTTPITLPETAGTVSATTIYIRMVAGLLNAGSPYSGNIICSSTGATSQNVAVDGTVTLAGSCTSIFSDDFSGTLAQWVNTTDWAIAAGELNHNLSGVAGQSHIYSDLGAQDLTSGDYEWEFCITNGNWDPSGSNDFSFFLISDDSNLQTNATGYAVGINQTTTTDFITLYSVNAGTYTEILASTYDWAPNDDVCIRVTRNSLGLWELFYNANSSGEVSAGTVIDTTFTTGQYIGGYFEYTATRAGLLWLDDINICATPVCIPTHTIISFSPTAAAIGATITITGTGFTAGSTVDFNGTPATVTFVNATTLSAVVPAGATSGVITVTEAGCPVDSPTSFTVSTCTPSHSITGFAPTSGPELTEVTITGTGFTGGTTVDFGGLSATIISQTATELIVEVPTGASSGAITVTESGCPLDTSTSFTLIDFSGSCSTGSFSDIIITEVYDSNAGNGWYMELYNPTGSDIDLDAVGTDFELERYATIGDAVPSRTIDLVGTITANSTFTVRCGDATPNPCSSVTFDFTELAAGINESDEIRLTKNGSQHDVVHCPNELGYSIQRINTSTGPSTTYNATDWTTLSSETCADLGVFSMPAVPSIDTQPADVTNCSTNMFSISATAGNSGTLTYIWKYNDGSATGWTNVSAATFSPGTVTGETTDTLTINGFNLEGYQFYCEVTEDATCAVSSNAAQFKVPTYTWDGTAWNSGIAPTLTENAVIAGNYDTASFGSFSSCQLFVNSGVTLAVDNSSFVEVENDVVVLGEILVETHGAFVQNNDASNFILDTGGLTSVNKTTSILNNWYDYTYWSSPVINETVGTAIDIAPADRRYWFNANNYLDVFAESNNDNTLVPGHDDIDDDGNDWQLAAAGDIMTPGIGLAATVSPTGFVVGTYQVNFDGAFNNGVISTPIAYNGANGDFDWNLIGNPYPCALDTNSFFTLNAAVLDGAAYLWSHTTPPSSTANGNEPMNFSQSDYSTITLSGVNVAGGDINNDGNIDASDIPGDYIPSGQGFFVRGLAAGNATFNNSMRMADTSSNNQFFRTTSSSDKNAVWINLTSNNGIFNQFAIGYIEGATDGNDGFSYDATRNLGSGYAAIIYTLIDDLDMKFAVQCKEPSSLNNDEIVSFGLKTNITNDVDSPTIYSISIAQVKGSIMSNADIYLKDNLLNVEHDLIQSDYTFSSEKGEFNDRFEIRFKSVERPYIEDSLIVTSENDNISFSTTNKSEISNVQIFDMLGRLIFNVVYSNETTNANIKTSVLPNAVFIAKVTLQNGSVLSKKLIKQ